MGSVAASQPKGEHEEATESHQLSSTATTTFHAMVGNDHGLFSCKGTAFQRQKEKNQYCVWERKKKLFSLTKLEWLQGHQLAKKGNLLTILPWHTTLLYKDDKKTEVCHVMKSVG